jgi:hypothetical protein
LAMIRLPAERALIGSHRRVSCDRFHGFVALTR